MRCVAQNRELQIMRVLHHPSSFRCVWCGRMELTASAQTLFVFVTTTTRQRVNETTTTCSSTCVLLWDRNSRGLALIALLSTSQLVLDFYVRP